jgi:hypothetical protein
MLTFSSPPTFISFADGLRLVRGEYEEMPGLKLTKLQAQHLWDLEPMMCDAIIDALVRTRYLRRTADGAYVRADLQR